MRLRLWIAKGVLRDWTSGVIIVVAATRERAVQLAISETGGPDSDNAREIEESIEEVSLDEEFCYALYGGG